MKPLLDCTAVITRQQLFDALTGGVSPSYARKLKSLVGRALDASECADGSTRDIRLLLTYLDRLESTRAVAPDAPAACRKIRALVLGRTGAERLVLPNKNTVLSDAWTALLSYGGRDDKRRNPSRLQALARAVDAAGGGEDAPAVLPSDEAIYASAAQIGLSEKTVLNAIRIYRRLRKCAIEVDERNRYRFAVLDDRRCIRGRNALAALRKSGDSEVTDAMGAIARLAPRFHAQLLKYQSHPLVKGKAHLASTVEANIAASSRLVGALYRYAPDRLPAFSIKHLWKDIVRMDPDQLEVEEWDEVPDAGSAVCLAHWVVAMTAPEIRTKCAPGLDSGYVSMVKADLKCWYSLTEWAHGTKMRAVAPEEWKSWRARYTSLRQHVTENLIPRDLLLHSKDKETIVNTFNLAHMYCVILPTLFREAERLLDRLDLEIAAAKKAGRDVSATQRDLPAGVYQALCAFEERAEPALALAFMFFDGMRSVQYRLGRYGINITPDIDSDTGAWFGVKTRWYGKRMATARVKQGKDRARQLGVAHISMRVLRGFVEHVRSRRLVAAGVPLAAATAPNGQFALFVSTTNAPEAWSDTHYQRRLVGAALYRVATELLGRQFGEEADYEAFDRKRFCGVLGTHASRYVIATGCAVLLDDDMQLAATLTSDDIDTLRESYVVSSWLPEGRIGTWENAESYRPWLEKMVRPGASEHPLDMMPTALLPPAIRTLFAKWAAEDREMQRRIARSTTGSPSGRVRRARPDVAERNRAAARERAEARARESTTEVELHEQRDHANRRAA